MNEKLGANGLQGAVLECSELSAHHLVLWNESPSIRFAMASPEQLMSIALGRLGMGEVEESRESASISSTD